MLIRSVLGGDRLLIVEGGDRRESLRRGRSRRIGGSGIYVVVVAAVGWKCFERQSGCRWAVVRVVVRETRNNWAEEADYQDKACPYLLSFQMVDLLWYGGG